MANTSSLTKAALEQQLAAALERVSSLELELTNLHQEAAAPERRDHLEQVMWLQREAPADRDRGFTREGSLWLRCGAQYAAVDRQSGRRSFGAYKNLVAYGEVARALDEVFATETRLVAVTAYERPWTSSQEGPRRSDWVVTSVTPIARTAPAAPSAPAPAYDGEPSSEEIPF